MVKRHIALVMGGLALGLAVFGSLALAQEPASQGDLEVPMSTPKVRVERGELGLPAGQVVSHAVRIEPARLQIAEEITVKAQMPLIVPPRSKARVVERYRPVQPIQRKFRALANRAVNKAYPITQPVPAHDSGSSDVRPAAVCMVNSMADSGSGTLRQCLENAVTGDTITFDATVFPPTSPATISLSNELPWIVTDSLTIDASNAGVILDGSGSSIGSGFVVSGADGVKIQGLQIVYFPWGGMAAIGGTTNTTIGGDRFTGSGPLGQGNLISGNGVVGVWIEGVGTFENQVLGNFIGTDTSGTAPLGNGQLGVLIGFGATNNVIGEDTPGTRNLISGNGDTGVWIQNAGTMSNTVLGNYIGTDVAGIASLGNGQVGVFIGFEAASNIMGGDTPRTRNLISGNGRTGVWIQDSGTSGNRIVGNHIGTDVFGTAPLGNAQVGVAILAGATSNTIGGDTPGAGNLISGNGIAGLWIEDVGTSGNDVWGNYIGTDGSGTASLGNAQVGVAILAGATSNTIGGDAPGAGNLISGNGTVGIWIEDVEGWGTSGNRVQGNYIGTDVSGTASLGNEQHGVFIGFGARENTISDNLISGNGYAGVHIQNAGTVSNTILGNYIGTAVSGTAALANVLFGVFIGFGATNNTIGGDAPGARNLISGNGYEGVFIQDAGTSGNRILGNYIGTDITGVASLGNRYGVAILGGATDNVVGGDTPGTRNLISGNRDSGILIGDSGTSGNRIFGNYIGSDISGTSFLGNGGGGVLISEGATNNTIGGDTSGARNLISGNEDTGVQIQNAGTTSNTVLGNHIGVDASGTVALGNAGPGVSIGGGATNNVVGGDTPKTRNIISGNKGNAGVEIALAGTEGNVVLGNYIGTNAIGTVSVANVEHGVAIYAGATGNVVGGATSGAGNLISGNGEAGVIIWSAGTSNNQVLGNSIGTDASGAVAIANYWGVVIADGPTGNVIGGDSAGARNLISGNAEAGVWIQGSGTTNNVVLGNYIGTTGSGLASLSNLLGVLIYNGATGNVIGGDSAGTRNLISGNAETGVRIEGSGAANNVVLGNYIGTTESGLTALPNRYGVLIYNGATNNTIGGVLSRTRNIVSGNGENGIVIWNATGNQVLGNYVGIDSTGAFPLGNARNGMLIGAGATSNIVGGDVPGARNLIGDNGAAGVWVQSEGTSGNRVLGNYVGTDTATAVSLGNRQYGVVIGFGATHNTIGISNTIVYNALAGVVVSGTNTLYNTVTRNVIHDNGGLPIDLVNLPIPVSPSPPALYGFSFPDDTVWGAACPGCRVEIFANPTAGPAGTIFLGAVWAGESGTFGLNLADSPPDLYLSATATDPGGTTSEFSEGLSWPDNPWFAVYLPVVTKNK